MSLATRCSECGTVFRVVPDQLKVSDGWVRCGRCSAVFNAQASLFDLDESAPAAAAAPTQLHWGDQSAPSSSDRSSDQLSGASPPSHFELDLGSAAAPTQAWLAADQGLQPALSAPSAPPAPSTPFDGGFDGGPEVPARAPIAANLPPMGDPSGLTEPAFDDGTPASVVSISQGAVAAAGPAAPADLQVDPDEVVPTPSFMQSGGTQPTHGRPLERRALLALAVLLGLALALQATLLWRDSLAAHFPALRPALAAACDALGCRVQALRRIDQLSVDASGLTHIDGAPLHRLSLGLRNRAEVALACPAIELNLTDAQGQLLARRVMQVADFGVAAATIAAGAELPLQALLSTGERRISGYTVELFYP